MRLQVGPESLNGVGFQPAARAGYAGALKRAVVRNQAAFLRATRRRPRLRRKARRARARSALRRPAGLASRRQGSRTSGRLPRRSRACRRSDRPRRSSSMRQPRRIVGGFLRQPAIIRALGKKQSCAEILIDRGIGLGDDRAAGLRPRAWVIAGKSASQARRRRSPRLSAVPGRLRRSPRLPRFCAFATRRFSFRLP